jgi:hypothetical protein
VRHATGPSRHRDAAMPADDGRKGPSAVLASIGVQVSGLPFVERAVTEAEAIVVVVVVRQVVMVVGWIKREGRYRTRDGRRRRWCGTSRGGSWQVEHRQSPGGL